MARGSGRVVVALQPYLTGERLTARQVYRLAVARAGDGFRGLLDDRRGAFSLGRPEDRQQADRGREQENRAGHGSSGTREQRHQAGV